MKNFMLAMSLMMVGSSAMALELPEFTCVNNQGVFAMTLTPTNRDSNFIAATFQYAGATTYTGRKDKTGCTATADLGCNAYGANNQICSATVHYEEQCVDSTTNRYVSFIIPNKMREGQPKKRLPYIVQDANYKVKKSDPNYKSNQYKCTAN